MRLEKIDLSSDGHRLVGDLCLLELGAVIPYYGHFSTREALVDGILDLTSEDFAHTFHTPDPDKPPAVASARFTIALWRVGDKYRLLLELTGTNFAPRIQERLALVHAHGATLLRHGQRLGVYSDHLPAEVLSRALSGLVMALLEACNDETWTEADPAGDAARACLIAAGIALAEADEISRAAAELENIIDVPVQPAAGNAG
ncbi:hypothetical protein AB4305_16600 [Nocardia sp. 2YAB30]|uniref:hypothetical protein n=1 Tax=unclassified Nocardia TaxID=2637762 RepID=UPI003F95F559